MNLKKNHSLLQPQIRQQRVLIRSWTLFLVVFLSIFIACKRESKDDIGNSEAKYVTPAPHSVGTMTELNDQKRYIALGLSELLTNSTMANLTNSKFNIFSYLSGFTSNDVMPIHALVNEANSAYDVPTALADNEFGDAINHSVGNSSAENFAIYSLNSNLWEWSALEKVIFGTRIWNAFVQVPDFQSRSSIYLARPICVVPMINDVNDVPIFPITAYIWDAVNSKVIQHSIQDDDEINDNPTYCIFVVDYAPGVELPEDDPGNLCSGDWAPTCGNDICEAKCGETIDNCTDCQPDKNKVLVIKKYALTMDHRVRALCSSNPTEFHLKQRGNFSLGYGAFVEKPNCNVIRTHGVFLTNKLKRSHAHLESQAMWTCNPTANNSGAIWSVDYPERDYKILGINQIGEAIIDPNYNPKLTNVSMFWHHFDEKGLTHTVKVSKSNCYSNIGINYVSVHSPLGRWDPATNHKIFGTSYSFWPFTSPADQLQLIAPDDWQNWSINPTVPSSDELQIITPNGDFMYVLEYRDQ